MTALVIVGTAVALLLWLWGRASSNQSQDGGGSHLRSRPSGDPLPDSTAAPPGVTCRVEPVQGSPTTIDKTADGGFFVMKFEPLRYYDFGLLDKKGRRIGMQVCGNCRFLADAGGAAVDGQSHHQRTYTITRDGELTTWTESPFFSSREQAEADVERHLAASVKRYAKTSRRA